MTVHGYPDSMSTGDVIDAAEAAKLIGVERDTFTSYVSRGQAPQPIGRLAGRNVYSRSEVLAWHATRPVAGSTA